MQYVQFSDSSKTEIIRWFAGPQDEAIYQNLGEVEDTDPLYTKFVSGLSPEFIQVQD